MLVMCAISHVGILFIFKYVLVSSKVNHQNTHSAGIQASGIGHGVQNSGERCCHCRAASCSCHQCHSASSGTIHSICAQSFWLAAHLKHMLVLHVSPRLRLLLRCLKAYSFLFLFSLSSQDRLVPGQLDDPSLKIWLRQCCLPMLYSSHSTYRVFAG